MTKITHTPNPLITTTGFIPDESTGINDEYYRKMREQKRSKREQAIDLLMLLSALESAFFASKSTMPDYLIERIDTAVSALRAEVLMEDKS